MKRENIPTGSGLSSHISTLIEKLAAEIKSGSSSKPAVTEELKNSIRSVSEGRIELERDRSTQMETTGADLVADSLDNLTEEKEVQSVRILHVNMGVHERGSVLRGKKDE